LQVKRGNKSEPRWAAEARLLQPDCDARSPGVAGCRPRVPGRSAEATLGRTLGGGSGWGRTRERARRPPRHMHPQGLHRARDRREDLDPHRGRPLPRTGLAISVTAKTILVLLRKCFVRGVADVIPSRGAAIFHHPFRGPFCPEAGITLSRYNTL